MKKIIGIIGVITVAMSMFFNVTPNSNNDLDLAGLIAINTANAETIPFGCYYTGNYYDLCKYESGRTYIRNCVNLPLAATCAYY